MTHLRAGSALALAIALAAVPAGTRAAEPYEIDVITSLTGSAALIGKQSSDSLHIIEDRVNRGGGIDGRPIKFVIGDDQTNPQVAVQLATRMIAQGAPVILGPNLTATCNAVAPLVRNGPVLWCFSPGFRPAKDGYAFSSLVSSADQIRDAAHYLHRMGLNRVALIVSTDATGQDGEQNIEAALAAPGMEGMSIVAREHFNVTDVSVAAQIARIKSSGAQAVFAWTSATPIATVLRDANSAGLDVPIVTTNANASAAQLKAYAGFVPKTLLFPAMLNQAPARLPNGPIKRKIEEFYGAFKAALGILPEGTNNIAWDSSLIVIDALKKYGASATAAQIRDYVEGLHGWVGINGAYDFRDGSQRGLGQQDVIVIRWDSARSDFVAISKPGGDPL